MHAPHGELDAFGLERFAPREHVVIDAIDERPIEVEQEGGVHRCSMPYLTYDLRHNRKVAIKVMHRDLAELLLVQREDDPDAKRVEIVRVDAAKPQIHEPAEPADGSLEHVAA